MTPRDILTRSKAPHLREFLRRAEDWLAALPPLDALGVADLVVLEQRQGCWGGVIKYADVGKAGARLSPANSRAMMETASRMRVEDRIACRLHEDVIAAAWPELLEHPFNNTAVPPLRRRYFAFRRGLSKSLERPAQVWRKGRGSPEWLRGRLRRLVGLPVPRRTQP
jgi:hypothetical protein